MTNPTATPSAPRIFTPVHRHSGNRLCLQIADRDIPRGRKWTRIIEDQLNGTRFRAWHKSCGLPGCLCDAYVEEI